jgi:hypothetical protein
MARIQTYANDGVVSEYDTVIGSDSESLNGTRNYSMANILKFLKSGLDPISGGTLNIRELTYAGSTYTTPYDYINGLDPNITILQYDVVIVNINSTKYLLKKQDVVVGVDQTPLISSDFILAKEPQVNSDWNASSGAAQILNKPSIFVPANADWNSTGGITEILNKPTVTPQVNSDWSSGSGVSQILNKPTIPAAQVNSDWNSSGGVSQILNKPINTNNLQKVVSANYVLTEADNNYTIIINNNSTAISIDIPSGLSNAFFVGFVQNGTGDVSFTSSAVIIRNPIGFKSKGQYYQTALEQYGVNGVFYLLGNTKV